jgi:hypothetical protein
MRSVVRLEVDPDRPAERQYQGRPDELQAREHPHHHNRGGQHEGQEVLAEIQHLRGAAFPEDFFAHPNRLHDCVPVQQVEKWAGIGGAG